MKAVILAVLMSSIAFAAPDRPAPPRRAPLGAVDVLIPCPDADARTFRAWTLDEAVVHLKACLAKVYKTPGAAVVKGETSKDGKRLLVILKRPLDAADAERLRAAIKRRHGRLYGYPALVTTAKTQR
jgi:hypothetical protein